MSEHTNPANPKPPSVDRLSLLWRRVNDHKMVQWSVAYIALAYGIQHGVELTSDAFEWPHAVVRVSMLLLVLGLPLVMTLAWYHGERASRRISGPELTIVSLLLVGISLFFYVFARPSEEVATTPKPAVQQAGVARPAASLPQPGGISIVVLPFANVSADASQDYFSDGMTDEISGALAKVPDLRVIARSSAFQFKGQNQDVRAVGQALGASHLIEGSVRQAGTRVRITAQLVRANDGVQLWSENYDRELTDIFATQEDIAQAIAGALRVPLGLQQGGRLVSNRTGDLESYKQYLRARALYRARTLDEAIAVLEPAVARDRGYAPAWALLAQAYVREPVFGAVLYRASVEEAHKVTQSFLDKAEMAAREAVRLDPKISEGYAALGVIEQFRGKTWLAAEDHFRQALALDPNDADTLHAYGTMLGDAGRLKNALPLREQLRMLEPFVPVYNATTALIMIARGQPEAAIRLLESIPDDSALGFTRHDFLARAYVGLGRRSEAADTLLSSPQTVRLSRPSIEDASRLLRSAPEKVGLTEKLPTLEGSLVWVYAYAGAPNRALETPERYAKIDYFPGSAFTDFWSPESAPVRKTERFKALVRAWGFVDYWRTRGWPDLCRPMGADDFVCD